MTKRLMSGKGIDALRLAEDDELVVRFKSVRRLRNEDDQLEIFVEDDRIILKKYEKSCVFCGSIDSIMDYKNKYVCADCIKELR